MTLEQRQTPPSRRQWRPDLWFALLVWLCALALAVAAIFLD